MNLNETNEKNLQLLNSQDNYPEKCGMLMAHARFLRSALNRLVTCLDNGENTDCALQIARLDLGMSQFLDYERWLRAQDVPPSTRRPISEMDEDDDLDSREDIERRENQIIDDQERSWNRRQGL